MQQAELLQSDVHRDWRDEESLSKGLGNAIKRFVVSLGTVEIADLKVEPRKFDIGMADRRSRPEDARLAIRERRIPGGEDQLARHQQARGVEIRLPFLAPLSLARSAN